MKRHHYELTGQVQGVGFRPFVYRTAQKLRLTGFVGNTPSGVQIEVQGKESSLDAFTLALRHDLPPLAHVVTCQCTELSIYPEESIFRIVISRNSGSHTALVSPDVATCADCLADMHEGRRKGYAFTNCTNCGPRYTITRSIPYDRPKTSMACFPLCPECQVEYDAPGDRRFHAQPNACPVCGPQLWLAKNIDDHLPENPPTTNECLETVVKALIAGKIVAIKGLGGFLLTCDARNREAILRLRERKHRPHKSLAVMLPNLEAARQVVRLNPQEESLLLSKEAPIVVAKRQDTDPLPREIAPDLDSIGVMLPYTPLHHLLLEAFSKISQYNAPALVMTSGNAIGEPIALGNREALQRLQGIADLFLLHNRDILVRVDDSVVRVLRPLQGEKNQLQFLRRARGFVPQPIFLTPLAKERNALLAVGGELKNTFCLTRQNQAFVSQHIGDMEHFETLGFFQETVNHLTNLLEVDIQAVVRDKHPDYASSQFAEEMAQQKEIPVLRLQHHFAHIYSVLAEHHVSDPALGLALDGTGFGDDGTIWGGELFFVNPEAVCQENPEPGERLGRLSPFPLPGGEIAIREPWRLAVAFRTLCGLLPQKNPQEQAVAEMVRASLQSRKAFVPFTSSCGRFFDAVSAQLNLCRTITYEGQAAILLEQAQNQNSTFNSLKTPDFLRQDASGLLELDTQQFFQYLLEMQASGYPISAIARQFHLVLVENLAEMAVRAAKAKNVKTIALAGGVLLNATIARHLPDALLRRGLSPLLSQHLPPGDGGICLGQAEWARRALIKKKKFF